MFDKKGTSIYFKKTFPFQSFHPELMEFAWLWVLTTFWTAMKWEVGDGLFGGMENVGFFQRLGCDGGWDVYEKYSLCYQRRACDNNLSSSHVISKSSPFPLLSNKPQNPRSLCVCLSERVSFQCRPVCWAVKEIYFSFLRYCVRHLYWDIAAVCIIISEQNI